MTKAEYRTYKALILSLRTLADQADEDTPADARSEHFREALNGAFSLLKIVDAK